MNTRFWLAASLAVAVAGCSGPRTATSVLEDVQEEIGNPTSIQYVGTGMNTFFDRH